MESPLPIAQSLYAIEDFMHRLQLIIFFLGSFLPVKGQKHTEIGSLPDFYDSIFISRIDHTQFKNVIRFNSDTVFIESFQHDSSTNKSTPFLFYSLPLANIRSLSVDSSMAGSIVLEFKSVSRRFEFETHIPTENRSFDIPVIYLNSDLPKEIKFYKKFASKVFPYIRVYKTDCSYTFKHYYGYDSEFFEGILDDNLVEKCSVNSSIAKDSILTQLLKDSLTDLVSKPRLKYLYVSLRIDKNDIVSEIYLGNYLMYLNALSRNLEISIDDSKSSHDDGGYLSETENIAIVNLIKTQKWQTGKCDENKVDTICLLNLELN